MAQSTDDCEPNVKTEEKASDGTKSSKNPTTQTKRFYVFYTNIVSQQSSHQISKSSDTGFMN